jgi:RimJ/RimL family protein N-acetyltransferase
MNPLKTDPGQPPQRVTIEGRYVRLEPLDSARHVDSLTTVLCGPEHAQLWDYLADGPYHSADDFSAAIKAKEESGDPLFFTIIDKQRESAAGYASLMSITPVHRVIEVGHIVFASALQRTTAATEAIYLLARYVFDELGYRRLEWKCNSENEPSRRAAVRFGFTYEGTFRQHMIIKGRNRDTAWYSMLDGEWPDRKRSFERWLDPGNFDEQGRQKQRLGGGS